MPTNPLFDHYENEDEQDILDELTVEAIQIHGQNMLYLPRKLYNRDQLYDQDARSYFDEYREAAFYIENVEGFQGDGSFLQAIAGLEIRDQVTLRVAITEFDTYIGTPLGLERPREGDLIYFPFNKKVFEIVFADPFQVWYPLGKLYSYKLTVQLYEYSGEDFNTGIEEIDDISNLSQDLFDWALLTEDGVPLLTENGDYIMVEDYDTAAIDPFDDSEIIQTEANEILDFTETDPFSEGPF